MTAQPAILEPVPAHARHLFFDLIPSAHPQAALRALAAACDGRSVVLGIGPDVTHALGKQIAGLRGFPDLSHAKPEIPVTQFALWLWLRGDAPGELLLRGHALQALIEPAFTLVQAIDSFRHQDNRDLTGYEVGPENSRDDAVIDAAVVQGQGAGIDGSSFAAVQQWLHDLPAFEAMPRVEQDNCIGRRRDDNQALADAPESAHVKRTAQADFDPEAFVVRRSMPWVSGADAGLMFLAFGKSFDAYEALLRRMTGYDDGISDALFGFTQPLGGGYYWCPPMAGHAVDLSALGASMASAPADILPGHALHKDGVSKRPSWWRNWKVMLPLWLAIGGLVWLGLHFNVDHSVIAGSVVAVGLLSNAFVWMLGVVSLVPIIGPIIVKILSIGFIWLLNAVGYLVSYIAIRRGYSKDVLTYRGLTVAVIIGIVTGYVLGKLL
ncbi:MAG: Dyp-type peroxidase [Thiobacillus sp.]